MTHRWSVGVGCDSGCDGGKAEDRWAQGRRNKLNEHRLGSVLVRVGDSALELEILIALELAPYRVLFSFQCRSRWMLCVCCLFPPAMIVPGSANAIFISTSPPRETKSPFENNTARGWKPTREM
jgi:hypothetical protein